ncbi:hypothetical protein AGMMS50267_11830 [Spirochaetia bacterium]|nr:hypothetical protein AGMMS50267_11830 [Spirochaetia bacterium]
MAAGKQVRLLALLLSALSISPVQAQRTGNPEPAVTRSGGDTTPIWRQALEGILLGPPQVQAESVTVVVEGGVIRSYSNRGTFLWSYPVPGRLSPFVSRSPDGTTYICQTTGTLIALNRAGRELWRRSLGTPITFPVLTGWDDRLFVFTRDRIRCYTASGNLLWRRNLEAAAALPPCLDQSGGFIMVLENGELLEVSPFGKTLSRKLPAIPAAMVPVSGDESAETTDRQPILILYKNGNAEISPGEQPAIPLPRIDGVPVAAAARGNRAAAALTNGRVVFLSLGSGDGNLPSPPRILWTGESHIKSAESEIRLLYDNRGIYVLSRSGASAFDEEGRRLWVFELRGGTAIPAFSDEGILFLGGRDWILHAYQMEDRLREQPRSLYGPAPPGRYGTGTHRRGEYNFRFDEAGIRSQLALIKGTINAGAVGESEIEFAAYLRELADTPPQNFPVPLNYRIEALRLLGRLGSRETIPFLASLYTRDGEPPIKAAAAEAIGSIGVDPDGLAFRAFTNFIYPLVPYRNEQVLAATAAAVGALCRFSGPLISAQGVKLLVDLGGGEHSRLVQRIARQELSSLLPK